VIKTFKNSYGQKKIYASILMVVFALSALLYPGSAAAANPISWVMDAVGSAALDATKGAILSSLYTFLQLIGRMLSFFIGLMHSVATIAVYPKTGVPVVEEMWKIFRDMANMIFILALIVMAFSTIFDLGSRFGAFKGTDWKSMLAKLLIAAVLINFSMTLGVVVIDIVQVPTNMLLTSMGDISGRLGGGLNVQGMLAYSGTGGSATITETADVTTAAIVSVVFMIILLGSFFMSILTATLFMIMRIPIIWMLLMFSPLIWIANIFPSTRKSFSEWWTKFLGWVLFLPYYLFFVYLALFVLSKQDSIWTSALQKAQTADYGLNTGNPGITVQVVFFYIIVNTILVGGTKLAMSSAQASATGVNKTLGKLTGDMLLSNTPWLGGYYKGGKTAIEARKKQFQQQGFQNKYLNKVYGGEAADKDRQAKMGQLFGVRGADLARQKVFTESAGKEFDLIKNDFDIGKIDIAKVKAGASGDAADPKVFAYRKMLAKLGELGDTQFEETIKAMSTVNNPYAAQDLIKTAQESEFAGIKAKTIHALAVNNDVARPARKELLKHMQGNAKVAKELTAAEYEEAIKMLGGDKSFEGSKFAKELGKFRPDLTYARQQTIRTADPAKMAEAMKDYRTKKGLAPTAPVTPADLEQDHYEAYIDKTEIKSVAELAYDGIWSEPSFQEALKEKLEAIPEPRKPASIRTDKEFQKTQVWQDWNSEYRQRARERNALVKNIKNTPESAQKLTVLRTAGLIT